MIQLEPLRFGSQLFTMRGGLCIELDGLIWDELGAIVQVLRKQLLVNLEGEKRV